MNRFVRTLDGGMVNLSDVVLIRPFDEETDGKRWEKYPIGIEWAVNSTEEVAVLAIRREPGDEQFARRWVQFAHQDEVNGIHREGAFIPAEPGWMLHPVDKEGNPHPFLLPEPVIAWAMPLGLPVVAYRGVVVSDAYWRLVRPDGARSAHAWKPDPVTGRIVEVRWEKPA